MILYSNSILNSKLIAVVIKEKKEPPFTTAKVMNEICQCSRKSIRLPACLSAHIDL